jgi:hypothetical protein
MRIMTATKSKIGGGGAGSNEGVSVWFDDLSQMADPMIQSQVDTMIDTMITASPLIRDAVYSIAAKLAGAHLTSYLAAQVKEQAAFAQELERQAIEDLEKLVRTPFFTDTVQSFKETKVKTDKFPRIYLSLDVNDNITTYNPATNSGNVYPCAQVDGKAKLWVGLDHIEVDIVGDPTLGDTPAVILQKLAAEWRSKQTQLNGASLPNINVVVAVDDGIPVMGTRPTQYKDYSINPIGVPTGNLASPALRVNIGFIDVSPYKYDKDIDYLNVTLELWSESTPGNFDVLGVKGLLYGMDNVYSNLTFQGPHSAIIDITTGEKASTSNSAASTKEPVLSDTFYFELTDPGDPSFANLTIGGSVLNGDQFTVTVDGNIYSYTAGIGDTPTTVATILAGQIDSHVDFVATANIGVITVSWNAPGIVGNGKPILTGVTNVLGSTATLTPASTATANGRNVNTLPAAGSIVYRHGELVDPTLPMLTPVTMPRTVGLLKGWSALDIVLAVANDMAQYSRTSRVLGSVRSPTRFVIQGTPFDAPGLTIVPYTRDIVHYKVVFDMLSVPAPLKFAALPKDMITTNLSTTFDNYPKSLVVPAITMNPSGGGGSLTKTPPISQTDKGRVFHVEPSASARFKRVFEDINRLTNQ